MDTTADKVPTIAELAELTGDAYVAGREAFIRAHGKDAWIDAVTRPKANTYARHAALGPIAGHE